MNINGKIVQLRAIEKEDLDFMRDMLNNAELESLVVGWAFPVSKNQQNNWFEKNTNDFENLRFIIETPEDGVVGLATLTNIDWKNRSASHGIKIATSANRTKGIGTDSVMALMKYSFDELQLNRIDASWLEDNIISQNLHLKCGWTIEGKKKACIYKGGEYRNLVIAGVLKEDYEKLIKENGYWD